MPPEVFCRDIRRCVSYPSILTLATRAPILPKNHYKLTFAIAAGSGVPELFALASGGSFRCRTRWFASPSEPFLDQRPFPLANAANLHAEWIWMSLAHTRPD
jgi:hypothetical protein